MKIGDLESQHKPTNAQPLPKRRTHFRQKVLIVPRLVVHRVPRLPLNAGVEVEKLLKSITVYAAATSPRKPPPWPYRCCILVLIS